jgi:HD superfamily phosphohydrolase
MYEIRDPIHGTISFSEREKQIVDHKFMQRLRHIRQLGLSYLVYPGSTHDRFSHGVGAMHVVSRIWDRIVETSGEILRQHFEDYDLQYFRRILRLAGLLHDLGHAPLSHVAERFLPHFNELPLPEDWFVEGKQDRQAKHEDYSVLLINALSDTDNSPLTPDEAQDITSLIHHQVVPSLSWEKRFGSSQTARVGIHRLLRSFISGELDCDRMDYLLRDAYYTGVAYGTYDIDHLITNLGLIEHENLLVPTIDSTAVRAFEDFLLARYHMFLQVYLHKTTIAFDYFLENAMLSGEVGLKIPAEVEGFSDLRDSTIVEHLFNAAKYSDNAWSVRLVNRIPPKMLFRASNSNAEDSAIMERLIVLLKNADVPFFKLDSKQYLSMSTPIPGRDKASGLMVRRKMFGRIVFEPVERYSELLHKYNEVIDLSNLYVLRENLPAAQKVIQDIGWPAIIETSNNKKQTQPKFL